MLHADNGSPMKGATLKVTLEHLGVTASYSRPRVSNDNPFSEALFRTCKYRPEWPSKGFNDIEAARGWVARFANWYNGEHLHSGIRFVAPNTRHAGQDQTVLPRAPASGQRRARQGQNGGQEQPRNWASVGPVWLNPERDTGALRTRDAA